MSQFANVRDIVFLTYLTGYNIRLIYKAINEYSLKNIDQFLRLVDESEKGGVAKAYTARIQEAESMASLCIDRMAYHGIRAIPYFHPDYPELLSRLPDKPPILYVKGRLVKMDLAAVIGTRKVSGLAKKYTDTYVNLLTKNSFGIVSGLALGIDTLAHKRTLEIGGYTVAVMPNSLDTIYPKDNYGLVASIIESGGALVSELAFEINRGKKSFVQRNRLQSGLSKLVIPVEMASQSGTMHTINFCKSQKRHLFLIMPTPKAEALPNYEGINSLISGQKSNPKERVHIIHNSSEFEQKLSEVKGIRSSFQGELFPIDKGS